MEDDDVVAPLAKKHRSDVDFGNGEKKVVKSKCDGLECKEQGKSTEEPERSKCDGESKRRVLERLGFDSSRVVFDEDCKECRAKYIELKPDQLTMYLHAYSYKVTV